MARPPMQCREDLKTLLRFRWGAHYHDVFESQSPKNCNRICGKNLQNQLEGFQASPLGRAKRSVSLEWRDLQQTHHLPKGHHISLTRPARKGLSSPFLIKKHPEQCNQKPTNGHFFLIPHPSFREEFQGLAFQVLGAFFINPPKVALIDPAISASQPYSTNTRPPSL